MAKFLTEEEEDAVRNGGLAGSEITPADIRSSNFQRIVGSMNRDYLEREDESRRQMSARTEQGAFADTGDDGTRSWQEALALQERQANDQREQAFQQKLDGYSQLEDTAKAQQQAIQQDRGTALLAMMDSIRKNGGVMSPALNQAMSAAFGFPVTGALLVNGGKNAGSVIIGTPQKDMGGRLTNSVGMMISPEQRYQIFKRLNTRQALPYMMADYAAIKRSSGLTDDQLANRGFSNPSGPQVVGATTDGKATSKLFGITSKPKPRAGIHVFGADGKGGFTNYDSDASTNFEMQVTEGGTRKSAEEARRAELLAKIQASKPRNGMSAEERKMTEDAKTDRLNKSLDARDKDRAANYEKSQREAELREKKFQYEVGKDMAKEAKDFLSTLSEEDREAFSKKYPNMAKSILGMGKDDEPDNGGKKTVKSRKRATGKDGKTYERIVYSDGTETINEVM